MKMFKKLQAIKISMVLAFTALAGNVLAYSHLPLLAVEYVNPYSAEGKNAVAEKMGEGWSWFIVSLISLLDRKSVV